MFVLCAHSVDIVPQKPLDTVVQSSLPSKGFLSILQIFIQMYSKLVSLWVVILVTSQTCAAENGK